MKELYTQFEKEAIYANYSISFAKTEGKYFYSQTQSMFDGWLLRQKNQLSIADAGRIYGEKALHHEHIQEET